MTYKPMSRAVTRIERRVPIRQALTVQEWRAIQDVIVEALAPYPEAKVAVSQALIKLEAEQHAKHQ